MAGTSNAVNITSAGIQTFSATTGLFSVSLVTQYGTIVAAAANLITSIAPSATTGVPFISQGASANPVYGTVLIAGGGSNAVSFGTTSGIVVYDGTSLVNYTGPKIDTSGRYTNTSQPAFLGTQNSTASDVTGVNFNIYVLGTTVDLTEVFDQGSNFDGTTGTFTAPVTGKYLFNSAVLITGGTVFASAASYISTSNRGYYNQESKVADAINNFTITCSVFTDMDAADTAQGWASSSGEATNIDDVNGTVASLTHFAGVLMC